MHIALLTNYNQYETKRYFCIHLAKAFNRLGLQTTILDWAELTKNPALREDYLRSCNPNATLFTCSFNSIASDEKGKYPQDYTRVPHVAFFVDPAYRYRNILKSKMTFATCVDHFDCDYIRSKGVNRTMFWAHAVESSLGPAANQEKPYDVVFLGSCYDHENLRIYWRKHFKDIEIQTIEEIIEIVLGDNCTPLYTAVKATMLKNGMAFADEEEWENWIHHYAFYVDSYMRGKDRTELIRSIKDAKVHVFGDPYWRTEQPLMGWEHSLKGMKNVTIYPAVNFQQSLAILKQSKICLNSMPFFKNGTHERIFTGLACEALPITTDNLWIRENFEHGKNMLIYPAQGWEEVNDWVNDYLASPGKLKQTVAAGRKKVMREHTWNVRVKQLLEGLKIGNSSLFTD